MYSFKKIITKIYFCSIVILLHKITYRLVYLCTLMAPVILKTPR